MEGVSDRLFRLPKAELHVHLDGSLRPATLLELARDRGVGLPADDVDALADFMVVSDATSLEDYLERFAVTLSVLQDAEALERTAYELAIDHAEENVRYLEVRFCPLLNTEAGLSPDEVLEAALAGLRRAEKETELVARVIVCALRSLPPSASTSMAELASAFLGRGVCGFDIAGAESGFPVSDHAEAFRLATARDVPITIHAGEGYGAASIRQALDVGNARRIGHGTRLREDDGLLTEVRRRGIPLEVCLTSNVQTGVVASVATHPAGDYLRAGVPVTLSTDNRLMSGVTLTDEFRNAERELEFDWPQLRAVARTGFEHAFVDPATRAGLLQTFDAAAATLDDATPS